MSTPEERRAARAKWPVRVFNLGEEPEVDWLSITTAEQRLQLVWELSARMAEFTRDALPSYSRSTIPVRVVRRS